MFEWGSFNFKDDREKMVYIPGVAKIHFRKVMNELWVAVERGDEVRDDEEFTEKAKSIEKEESAGAEVEDEKAWSRWVLNTNEPEIEIHPAFQELPLVVRPEYPIRMVSGSEAKFYTRVPIIMQIIDLAENGLKITEVPSIPLVRTWFGTFLSGEMAYWLKTTARREISKDMFKSHLCICPIVIKNNSDEELHVEKLCLRVDRLSIFKDNSTNQLWSDQMKIECKGQDNYSDLVVSGKQPDEVIDGQLVGKPRNPLKKGIAEKTFNIIHELPNLALKIG